WKRQRQGGGRPAAGGQGDELVLTVWEATLEISLKRSAARTHMPGPVSQLGSEQVLHASLKDRLLRGQASGLMQGDQGGARGVSVGFHGIELCPAAVGTLSLHQILGGGLDFLGGGIHGLEGPQAKNAILGVLGRRLRQPAPNRADAGG